MLGHLWLWLDTTLGYLEMHRHNVVGYSPRDSSQLLHAWSPNVLAIWQEDLPGHDMMSHLPLLMGYEKNNPHKLQFLHLTWIRCTEANTNIISTLTFIFNQHYLANWLSLSQMHFFYHSSSLSDNSTLMKTNRSYISSPLKCRRRSIYFFTEYPAATQIHEMYTSKIK